MHNSTKARLQEIPTIPYTLNPKPSTLVRGALLQKKAAKKENDATRKSTATRIRVLELVKQSRHLWTASVLNDLRLLDAISMVLAEVTPFKVLEESHCLHIRFSEEALGSKKLFTAWAHRLQIRGLQ